MEFSDIKALVDIFNPPKNDDSDREIEELDDCQDSSSDKPQTKFQVAKSPRLPKNSPYTKIDPEPKPKDDVEKYYEMVDQVETNTQPTTNTDWKKTPQWNISYSQKVSASDVFLQMGAKNPSTASCENMIISITLPGEHMQNIDLKLEKEKLEINSPNFYLSMPLPHPVDPKLGNAKWENDQEKLVITLEMQREFDFINF